MAWRGFATTTVTTMSPRAPERHRRWLRWLVPGALIALAPKCGLCVLGYLGLGAALGVGGPEICGAIGGTTPHWSVWLILPVPMILFVLAGWNWLARMPKRRPSGNSNPAAVRS